MIIATMLADATYTEIDKKNSIKKFKKNVSVWAAKEIISLSTNGISKCTEKTFKYLKRKIIVQSFFEKFLIRDNEMYTMLKSEFNINYIIVDELDRVPPNVALSLIREVTYLNCSENDEIPDFIISANFIALEQILKHQYGNDYESEAYFDKMFDQIFDLKAGIRDKLIYLVSKLDVNNVNTVEIIKAILENYSNNNYNELLFLDKLSFRKIEWFAEDIKNLKYDSTDTKLICLSVLSLKYTNFSEYCILQNNQNKKVSEEKLEKLFPTLPPKEVKNRYILKFKD